MTQGKDRLNEAFVDPYSVNVRKILNRLITVHDAKQEWLAEVCGCTTQAMGQYRSGKRPLPLHIAARVDIAFECHEMHDEMGRMEGRAS
jgi:hypothetical protein